MTVASLPGFVYFLGTGVAETDIFEIYAIAGIHRKFLATATTFEGLSAFVFP